MKLTTSAPCHCEQERIVKHPNRDRAVCFEIRGLGYPSEKSCVVRKQKCGRERSFRCSSARLSITRMCTASKNPSAQRIKHLRGHILDSPIGKGQLIRVHINNLSSLTSLKSKIEICFQGSYTRQLDTH